jgi:SAM-dependent methyltransferase
MDNYEYCIQYALNLSKDNSFSILDYGCGTGKIVAELQKKGVNAFGCDVFYDAADYSKKLPDGFMDDVILKMEEGRIPFPSNSFDLVINNQVLEHVQDLNLVLSELQRVLKPGGRVLSLFPYKGVWREGHCGIPFLHWFPKGSKVKIFYALVLRLLGLGHYKKKKSYYQWSKDFCEWLDKWTYYRSYSEIRGSFSTYFTPFEHIEGDWLDRRLEKRLSWAKKLPVILKNIIVWKLGGLVIVCRKRCS